jgi:DNA primase
MSLGNVQLSPQLVQAVRDAADIVQVAGEHTRLKKAGRRYMGLCPLHKEKSPSFSVDPTQGLFYCFGCGAGGDAIKLHMLLTGEDFPGAIESLALRHGIPLPSVAAPRRGSSEATEPDLERVLEAAATFFRAELAKSASARDYLATRRIPPALGERFGLGYAPDGWRGLLDALHPRLPIGELEAAGLLTRGDGDRPYDRFRHRLMFPIKNAAGRLVGFGGRTLGDDRAKYINTNETERFQKGHLLYGLDLAKKAIRESGRVILVEGYFDVIGTVACGLEETVASMGTALTPEQVRLLGRYTDEVVVAYDGDDAGENAFRRALPLLLAAGAAVRRPVFPDRHDPDSLRLAAGPEKVVAALQAAKDGVRLELERLAPLDIKREPRLRARAADAAVELIRPIKDTSLRWNYGRMAADRLEMPAKLMWDRLGVDQRAFAGQAKAARTAAPGPMTADGPLRLHPNREAATIQLLFEDEAVALAELPSGLDLFEDELPRNIYRAVCAYMAGGGRLPATFRDVSVHLAQDQPAIDLLSRLLLERPDGPGNPGELRACLDTLVASGIDRRQRAIAREIEQAEAAGDRVRASELYYEKQALRRQLDALRAAKS